MTHLKIVQQLAVVCGLMVAVVRMPAQESRTPAASAQTGGSVAQLYFYTIKNQSTFEEGYRRHLRWHAAHNDQLCVVRMER